MGILSGVSKAFGENAFDKLLRAQSIIQGDYGTAARITGGMEQEKRAKEAQQQAEQKRVLFYQALRAQGVPEDQAYILSQNIEAASKAQAEGWGASIKPLQFGPEGGSVGASDGKGGYNTVYTAPAWQNGSYFGATQGDAKPNLMIEGEKAIPIEKGGAVAGVKPYSGDARAIVAPNVGQGQFGQPVTGSNVPTGSPLSQPQARPILPQRPQGLSDSELIDQARKAIEQGANVNDVFRQLKEWGVNP